MAGLLLALFVWAVGTVVFSAMQIIGNVRFGRAGEFWAPVWWIALTWPWWVAVTFCEAARGKGWR